MENQSLLSLANRYFKYRGYTIEQNVTIDGFSGLPQRFDLILHKKDEKRIVLVMDWNRPVGVNMAIKIDKASMDVNISNPIMVASKFSSHVKAYSNRRRIALLTKREILSELKTPR